MEYNIVDGIKIYTGTTPELRERYIRSINYLKSLVKNEELFSKPVPSTLTSSGEMSNISFIEKDIFDMLDNPTGNIMLIGCNYGEKFNPLYEPPKKEKKSGRGRKPKPKIKTKRKSQGTGNYFASQITFVIRHPETKIDYKMKLFRNGVFQVPGIKDPEMRDLIKPCIILRSYLAKNFFEDVQIMNFNAVMRNYKSRIIDECYRADLSYLEDVINFYKSYKICEPLLKKTLRPLQSRDVERVMSFCGKSNIFNIAEVNYNTDKNFCLNLKFYRPIPNDPTKKTTVKLLKKGKINFDGGNSSYEMLELYYWLKYVYITFKDLILVDINKITNEYDIEALKKVQIDEAIYSDDSDEESEDSD